MATISLQGNPIETVGDLPKIGANAPDFTFVKKDLSETKLSDYKGKKLILNIFPSIDTGTCATSVRKFNQEAANLKNTEVLCVSADLPFASARFCGAEGIDKVSSVSVFRSPEFGQDYGVQIKTGPLSGLLSRSVVVIDESGKVVYTEQVSEIIDEPNYAPALAALS